MIEAMMMGGVSMNIKNVTHFSINGMSYGENPIPTATGAVDPSKTLIISNSIAQSSSESGEYLCRISSSNTIEIFSALPSNPTTVSVDSIFQIIELAGKVSVYPFFNKSNDTFRKAREFVIDSHVDVNRSFILFSSSLYQANTVAANNARAMFASFVDGSSNHLESGESNIVSVTAGTTNTGFNRIVSGYVISS